MREMYGYYNTESENISREEKKIIDESIDELINTVLHELDKLAPMS